MKLGNKRQGTHRLVLRRKAGQRVVITINGVEVDVHRTRDGLVIDAPLQASVVRGELVDSESTAAACAS